MGGRGAAGGGARKIGMGWIRKNVGGFDSISQDASGEFTARRTFFYRQGQDSATFAAALRKQIPGIRITDDGEHNASFRGGASAGQSSHWWVKFRV